MKIYIILIILGFTQIINGFALPNVTFDDSFPVCPINLFRRKRALGEYTRWIANLETSPEFLVKVLDDELTTPITKQIVAVNIQPVTRGGEKIIVGGVIVPAVTTAQIPPEGAQDYTRFVPPTTVTITKIDDELYLAPQTPSRVDRIPPIRPKARHSQRDESPPASPQFLARATPILLARQYAPIEPVAFTKQTTVEPRTSPYVFQKNIDYTHITPPTRTSYINDIIWPKRTSVATINFKDSFIDEDLTTVINSPAHADSPFRTTTILMPMDAEFVVPSRISNEEIGEIDNEIIKKSKGLEKAEIYSDNLYNMMVYSDEDNESSKKKDEQDVTNVNYADTVKTNVELDVTTEKDSDGIDLDTADKKTPETVLESEYDLEEESNVPINSPTKRVFGVKEGTANLTRSVKKKVRRKTCNLLKLRQINFNSPRTLPEVKTDFNL